MIITHKGPRAKSEIKTRQETELTVDNARAAKDLLTILGFSKRASFEKRREKWTLDDCHIELDEVPMLGRFVEIEGPDETKVLAVRKKLGLDGEPLVRESYISMLRQHVEAEGMNMEHVGFGEK